MHQILKCGKKLFPTVFGFIKQDSKSKARKNAHLNTTKSDANSSQLVDSALRSSIF